MISSARLEELRALTAHNSSFSRLTPGLQLAVDSTSLGAFKVCPRFYELSIIRGLQPRQQSVHLTFGLHLHKARETYDHARLAGDDHEAALRKSLLEALRATWNRELGRPWIASGKGSDQKNRASLIRTIVWYLDEFGQNDPIETLRLSNGKPAVELSFRFDFGYKTYEGEPVLGCGHLDRVGLLQGEHYIVDIKTTAWALSPAWFKSWSPGNQFSMYTCGGQIGFSFPIKGLIVDGIQVGATFSRHQRGLVPRTPQIMEEWLQDTSWWVKLMEACARSGYWPMNDKSCDKYGGCQYRDLCSKNPSARLKWAQADFTSRVWDPLQVRGDV